MHTALVREDSSNVRLSLQNQVYEEHKLLLWQNTFDFIMLLTSWIDFVYVFTTIVRIVHVCGWMVPMKCISPHFGTYHFSIDILSGQIDYLIDLNSYIRWRYSSISSRLIFCHRQYQPARNPWKILTTFVCFSSIKCCIRVRSHFKLISSVYYRTWGDFIHVCGCPLHTFLLPDISREERENDFIQWQNI